MVGVWYHSLVRSNSYHSFKWTNNREATLAHVERYTLYVGGSGSGNYANIQDAVWREVGYSS